MNKKEFQDYYGFTDENMEKISTVLKIFNGKIISIDKTASSVKVVSKEELK